MNLTPEQLEAVKGGAVRILSPEALDAGEHAAYTLLANLILNLDETITKE